MSVMIVAVGVMIDTTMWLAATESVTHAMLYSYYTASGTIQHRKSSAGGSRHIIVERQASTEGASRNDDNNNY